MEQLNLVKEKINKINKDDNLELLISIVGVLCDFNINNKDNKLSLALLAFFKKMKSGKIEGLEHVGIFECSIGNTKYTEHLFFISNDTKSVEIKINERIVYEEKDIPEEYKHSFLPFNGKFVSVSGMDMVIDIIL